MGRGSPLTSRGFEPVLSPVSGGTQSIWEERRFLSLFFFFSFSPAQRRGAMATRWQSYVCPDLLSDAFQHFPFAMLRYPCNYSQNVWIW